MSLESLWVVCRGAALLLRARSGARRRRRGAGAAGGGGARSRARLPACVAAEARLPTMHPRSDLIFFSFLAVHDQLWTAQIH